MPIYDIFSKREKRLRGELPDVYEYETIPKALRIQVLHIWSDVHGPDDPYRDSMRAYRHISSVLCREYGWFRLAEAINLFESVRRFFLGTQNTKEAIDVIEVSFIVNPRNKGTLFQKYVILFVLWHIHQIYAPASFNS